MKQAIPIFKREFLGYFRSPIAYVFLAVFALMATVLALFAVDLLESNSASLERFFGILPWMFMVFAPATAMRLWAEERRAGTIELLFTLPVATTEAVLGKFFAAWAFMALGVALTFPLVLTVAWLGDPDWGVLAASCFGSLLMAAGYLSISSFMSALTRNQVVAFVVALFACLMLTLAGWSLFSDILEAFLPVWMADGLANFSFITHFDSMTRGLVALRGVVFFAALTTVMLALNVVVLER
jgi:ABC-2 type transport system permease protein